MLLSRRGSSLSDLVLVLDEYRDNVGELDAPPSEEAENGGGDDDSRPPTEGEERRAILDQLARYLESFGA